MRPLAKKYINISIIILVFSFSISNAFSQSISELKEQKRRAEKEIALTSKMLKETKKSKSNTLNQLLLIKRKIELQEELIANLNSEIDHYGFVKDTVEQNITKAKEDLKLLKSEYAKIIYTAYKNKHGIDKWLFVFSAHDFNQAYRRLKYLQQYSDYRKEQVALIQAQELVLLGMLDSLQLVVEKKQLVLLSLQDEKQKLSEEKKNENTVYASLQKQERELKKELKSQERTAKQVKKSIERILEEERKKRLAAKKAGKTFSLTPEEQLVSDNFSKNKGKLPWPTERGVIVKSYGEHAHPVLKGIKTFNNGIDISTEEGAYVRVLFNGEVRDVWPIQGRNMAVIVKHGSYFSVYQNLVDVNVKPGDKVTTKEVIGTIFTDAQDGNKTVLHLEVWKGSSRHNPVKWLSK